MKKIDHIAIAVWDIDKSIPYYVNQLGFPLIEDERLSHVRLAYFDAGNTMIQLVQPLMEGAIKDFLKINGEGLHHICFGVADIPEELARLGINVPSKIEIGGRERRCSFLPEPPNGLRIELTEFEPYMQKDKSVGA